MVVKDPSRLKYTLFNGLRGYGLKDGGRLDSEELGVSDTLRRPEKHTCEYRGKVHEGEDVD